MTTDAIVPSEQPLVPQPPAVLQKPSTLRKIFVGIEGIRAGWSMLLFIIIFALLVAAVIFTANKLRSGSGQPSKGMSEITLKFELINETMLAALTLLATWIMAKIERRG